MICNGCKYFEVCGDTEREIPCNGKEIELPDEIMPGDVLEYAEKFMDKKDIDHHYSDLYLRVMPESKAIIEKLKYDALLETFVSPIDGKLWYDLPFCYYERR